MDVGVLYNQPELVKTFHPKSFLCAMVHVYPKLVWFRWLEWKRKLRGELDAPQPTPRLENGGIDWAAVIG
mgnify:CR=1 FL=1